MNNKIDGRYLRELRIKHNYSIRELAEKIYVSKSTLQRWEKSHLPEQEDVLNKIAEVFDVTVEEIRKNSDLKYRNIKEKDFTQEQLAEMKFGIKWLAVPFILSFAVLFIFIFMSIFI